VSFETFVVTLFLVFEIFYAGKLVTDLKKIRFKYATTWFIIDLLSCLPLDTVNLIFGEVKEQV